MKNKKLLMSPLALAAGIGWGAAQAVPPNQVTPWGTAPAQQPSEQGNGGGQWGEVFKGLGNPTHNRCQGMSRGVNCITPATRKDAARRAAAARAAADGGPVPASVTGGSGGTNQ